MNTQRFQQVDRIFQAALDTDPDLRMQFVVEACGGEQDLYDEVTSLLVRRPLRSPAPCRRAC